MHLPKHLTKYIVAVGLLLSAAQLVAPQAKAIDPFSGCGTDCATFKDNSLTGGTGFKVKNIINLALQILGGVAVIMVIIGAIKMVVSNGDPSQVKSGRETILYSVIGIIVAVSAYAIINFVISFKW